MKVNEIVKKIPTKQCVRLTYKVDATTTYIVTSQNNKYYLYLALSTEYKLIKTRTDNPLFPECYPEYYEKEM